eukprot:GEMP01048424.1.p1 GENE.GEMP01048424.1~~GEMP01048424.1.p1  ORF type:complete len:179 (+),score=22.55 GEMP01048424.1:77-613(+)
MLNLHINNGYARATMCRELDQIERYDIQNNTDPKQLKRIYTRPWIGCNGCLRFGKHWDAEPCLSLAVNQGRPYRYLDDRLQPWKRRTADSLTSVTLEPRRQRKKPGDDKGRVTTITKLSQVSQFWPTSEENYLSGAVLEIPVGIATCMCGMGPTCHKPSPPAPMHTLPRVHSDPLFSV